MRIPLSAPDITEEEINAVVEVLRSNHLSLGPKLTEFENAVAEYSDAKYGIAVNSGTSGLHLCVRSFGFCEGDEIITTPFSFVASANVILYEKCTPVFVDIDPITLNIDATKVEAAISPKTKAILVVHVFGRPSPMKKICEIAERHNLIIIEDACESIGAEYQNKRTGNLGDCGVFAFYPNKQITTGEGGVIVTDNKNIADKCRQLRNQGRDANSEWFEHTELGYNFRISDINCTLGIEQLKRIEDILQMRESVAKKYHERLKENQHLILPELEFSDGRLSWFVYTVRLNDSFNREHRDTIINQLTEKRIGCGRYFAPIHLQPFYTKKFGFKRGDFPIAESSSDRIIALPFFNKITDSQIDEVCNTVSALIEKVR